MEDEVTIQQQRSMVQDSEMLDLVFTRLLTEYEIEVTRLAYLYVKEWNTAQDICQEVFISVYKNLSSFQQKSSYKTWIYSITANKCKDYLRSSYFKRTIFSSGREEENASDSVTPEIEMVTKENDSALYLLVLKLPVKYREVIILYYYKELNTEEISDLFGVSSSTVRTRLDRARKKLNKEMKGELR